MLEFLIEIGTGVFDLFMTDGVGFIVVETISGGCVTFSGGLVVVMGVTMDSWGIFELGWSLKCNLKSRMGEDVV